MKKRNTKFDKHTNGESTKGVEKYEINNQGHKESFRKEDKYHFLFDNLQYD